MKPVWLLCYQRTGTHLLYDCLNQTGLFDPPFEEWMNLFQTTLPIPKWEPWHNRILSPEEYIQSAPPFCSVHRTHFDYILLDEHKPLIHKYLPGIRYIRLRRRDHIAVAVSIYLARETETWWFQTEEEKEKHKNINFKINRRRLYQIYLNHLWLYDCWNQYLDGEDFLDLHYEDLVENQYESVKKVFDYLGIDQEPKETRFLQNDHPLKEVMYQLLEDAIDTGMVELSPVIQQPAPPIPLM